MIATKFKRPCIILLSVSLCLLLCACQPDNTKSVPTEQLIQAGKSPQQLLEEQPIDDTHDAFLVDTGGELGTLLVTVEWDAENSQRNYTNYNAMLHFSVWDLAQMDTPLQTMETHSSVFHHKEVVDANFDGYQDFGYMYALSNQPNYWHFWIWDESEKQFVREEAFDAISDPTFDQEMKAINGFARTSGLGTGTTTIHQWIDGKLVCMRRISIELDMQNDYFVFTVADCIDNELMEIYRNTFPTNTTEYLDMLMEWRNLNYHGEP